MNSVTPLMAEEGQNMRLIVQFAVILCVCVCVAIVVLVVPC